ncbi:GNAT family N-acetyltransferase [Grimontia hollisae]|uniref:Acetyltransferase GNAT family n=1 Tax=Grimontia hollisae CIP 101886 TaxID=675812 RepID=D0I5W6_GRIHO|nr:GNAT family N-acetyltransferase [Grimontia hollisae]AMG29119.1 GNAT family N-acetyltransferase [Grimontia hollisae]EEY73280.1 acetyltransferase GNAT family [Grimontia hollisae CIP 101886]STO76850.1 putative acyltransferase [Grimontia hollisae]STQ76020.1 putative acyltransferase [Grimontia hollisae]
MITIRRYREGEEPLLWTLFFNTVRNINIRDYSSAQVSAWAPHDFDPAIWKQNIQAINPFVAEWEGKIAGYADVQADGLIDHFFCDRAFQGIGIGRALMEALFDEGRRLGVTRYYAHVSITARPFFEHMGFTVVKEQQVDVRGTVLTNFMMEHVRQ